MTHFKVIFEGTQASIPVNRYWLEPRQDCNLYTQLHWEIEQEVRSPHFSLAWKDDEDDFVALKSEAALQVALKLNPTKDPNRALHVYVRPADNNTNNNSISTNNNSISTNNVAQQLSPNGSPQFDATTCLLTPPPSFLHFMTRHLNTIGPTFLAPAMHAFNPMGSLAAIEENCHGRKDSRKRQQLMDKPEDLRKPASSSGRGKRSAPAAVVAPADDALSMFSSSMDTGGHQNQVSSTNNRDEERPSKLRTLLNAGNAASLRNAQSEVMAALLTDMPPEVPVVPLAKLPLPRSSNNNGTGMRRTRRASATRIRSGRKEYLCQECGKVCNTNQRLQSHMASHSDSRPFICEHCEKSFKHQTNLHTHKKRIHPELMIVRPATPVEEDDDAEEEESRQREPHPASPSSITAASPTVVRKKQANLDNILKKKFTCTSASSSSAGSDDSDSHLLVDHRKAAGGPASSSRRLLNRPTMSRSPSYNGM
ncbi:hypothetical protein BV898_16201 [Hypsibius exemplaris]|uniref:C2H2-type domain-containing protein n=1 Tax=Hypsibius exemplaris TaxID=2072580 RepID=A0A9X6NLI8_HYPEX|nr:hypothetical protein BV898_16201 [Hypsibius exemplaris]